MKQHRDTVWQRRGISWIWHPDALAQVAKPGEVWSLRQFLCAKRRWVSGQALPSNHGKTLVVAGLDASLDLLSPMDAEIWLECEIKEAIRSFQDGISNELALIFWLPSGKQRFHVNPATDAVIWKCAGPFTDETLEFGRLLWGEANGYPQEIILGGKDALAGFYHGRFS